MTTFQLSRFSPEEPHLDGIATVYARALNLDWTEEYPVLQFYSRMFGDFQGVAALVGDEVVGVGWGTRTQPGEWLYDRVAAQIGGDHPALQNTWLLNILAVLERYRGLGIGTGLHNWQLAAQPCPRPLVCTDIDNQTARRFYKQLGWHALQPDCTVQVGERQVIVLHKELHASPLSDPRHQL